MCAGGGRPEDTELVVGSGVLETVQWSSPELHGSLERCFDGRSGVLLLWVLCRLPEVGRAVCCSLDQVEDAGDLLEVRRAFLDAQEGREKAGEEVWSSGEFWTELGRGVCCGCLWL